MMISHYSFWLKVSIVTSYIFPLCTPVAVSTNPDRNLENGVLGRRTNLTTTGVGNTTLWNTTSPTTNNTCGDLSPASFFDVSHKN